LWEKGCAWQGVLSYSKSRKVDLLAKDDDTKHHKHDIEELVGKTGCKSLEQKRFLHQQFQGITSIQPRTALRVLQIDCSVAEGDKDINLRG